MNIVTLFALLFLFLNILFSIFTFFYRLFHRGKKSSTINPSIQSIIQSFFAFSLKLCHNIFFSFYCSCKFKCMFPFHRFLPIQGVFDLDLDTLEKQHAKNNLLLYFLLVFQRPLTAIFVKTSVLDIIYCSNY